MMSNDGNEMPPFVGPHEGREYDLMMSGAKNLAMFEIEEAHRYDCYPDPRFETAVTNGTLVKSSYVIDYVLSDGSKIAVRIIMYATPAEEWRISAMQSVKEVYRRMGPGWRPDLERVIGDLLGYDTQDVESFIERLFQTGAFMGAACPTSEQADKN